MPDQLHSLSCYINYLWQHRYMYLVTVRNDLKGKFKYTILGYFWHLLNPLSQIVIYLLVFTVTFGHGVPNYWVYISTGMFPFSFMVASVVGGSTSITGNARVVTKMAMAREILIFSKITVNLVNLTISYSLLLILMAIAGVNITINVLIVPIIIFFFVIFCTGLALALSAIVVYIRDMAHVVSIIMNMMLFAVPIIYMKSVEINEAMKIFWTINPLFYYLDTIHDAFYWGIPPDMSQLIICMIVAPLTFVFGLIIFKKLEPGFAERL